MQTPETPSPPALTFSRRDWLSLLLFSGLSWAGGGCKKSAAEDASDSDANGYLCLQCNAKMFTDRSVFIGPKCPKCQKDGLIEVIGYYCEKDQHLTIRPRAGDRLGATVCDKCRGPVPAMRLPRQKDLQAWGATEVAS
ncbi:MAG TPA: hypothetical protein VN673_00995 [Clostridia bacterium]|nr:hypothetical protein [Clostridia bacterium]